MADSEKSFADRVQKTTSLLAAATGFTPTYTPADILFSLTTVTTKNTAAETANNNVAAALSTWSTAVQQRLAQSDLIKARATMLINYIKSNTAWKTQAVRAKQLADAIRNIKIARKTTPPAAPGTPAAAAPRQRGGQSYAEIEQNWRSLVSLATSLPGYAPPITNTNLQTLNLTLTVTTMATLNDTIATTEEALSNIRQQRLDTYFGPDGLAVKFAGLKQAIKGQYGPSSAQWTQVKGIKW